MLQFIDSPYLPEIIGEETITLYSSYANQFEWRQYGLNVRVHGDTLPVGMEQCTINIKVSPTGQYEFPENYHLVSAVYWFRCADTSKFKKPITVEIQHCAKSTSELTFVRAFCSQKQLPYTFKPIPGGNFSNSSYGIIHLSSFSGIGITQTGSENAEREYCSTLFYSSLNIIDYVITWNLEPLINVSP